jgi:hypothetical protein
MSGAPPIALVVTGLALAGAALYVGTRPS